ncbi:YdcF family protein [Tissierella praeacuta]|uniref:YdcF family protein n=1 Tax=Tissierella praeacuta TaxID=43131 RepID=UPI0028A90E8D|nr:YdcF family protein [Tissierella praeacuta]
MKRLIYRIAKSVLFISFLIFILIESLIIIGGRRTTDVKVDYVIVLGARLYGDIPSPALLERLKVAKDYLIDNTDVKVVVSGGQGLDEDIAEAYAMKKYLINNGIEKDRIIVEDKSTTTFENLKFSLDKIKEINDNNNISLLIASNRYHIFRAKLLAKRLGAIPYGLPAKTPLIIVLQSYIREFLAVIKSYFIDRVRV